jgi:hemerythrin-like domain-containing protein
MNPIEALMNEHRVIESVLDAFESYVDRLAPDSPADPADLGRFTRFIREFADTCHHGKEEDILFEAMVLNGMPRDTGPIAVMLHEHDQGRQLVRTWTDCAARAAESGWNDGERQCLRLAAHTYANHLRHHIQKEDGVLYQMAATQLDAAAMAEIARRFEVFEAEKTGPGGHAALHALAEDLIARYGASGPAPHRHTHPQ